MRSNNYLKVNRFVILMCFHCFLCYNLCLVQAYKVTVGPRNKSNPGMSNSLFRQSPIISNNFCFPQSIKSYSDYSQFFNSIWTLHKISLFLAQSM